MTARRTPCDLSLPENDLSLPFQARLHLRQKRQADMAPELRELRTWMRAHSGKAPKADVRALRAWLRESRAAFDAKRAPKRRPPRERTTPMPDLDDLTAFTQWLLANWPK